MIPERRSDSSPLDKLREAEKQLEAHLARLSRATGGRGGTDAAGYASNSGSWGADKSNSRERTTLDDGLRKEQQGRQQHERQDDQHPHQRLNQQHREQQSSRDAGDQDAAFRL